MGRITPAPSVALKGEAGPTVQGAEKGVVMAFSSAFVTCPPPTARTTAGTSTRQDVD